MCFVLTQLAWLTGCVLCANVSCWSSLSLPQQACLLAQGLSLLLNNRPRVSVLWRQQIMFIASCIQLLHVVHKCKKTSDIILMNRHREHGYCWSSPILAGRFWLHFLCHSRTTSSLIALAIRPPIINQTMSGMIDTVNNYKMVHIQSMLLITNYKQYEYAKLFV